MRSFYDEFMRPNSETHLSARALINKPEPVIVLATDRKTLRKNGERSARTRLAKGVVAKLKAMGF